MSLILTTCRYRVADGSLLTYASDLVPKSTARYGSLAYLRLWLRTPASTLPTRFPAALGIGHGPAFGLANACALVYVAA